MNKTEIRIKCATQAETMLKRLLAEDEGLAMEVVATFNEARTNYPDQRIGQIFCNYICPDYRCEPRSSATELLMTKLFDINMDPFFEESDTTIRRWEKLEVTEVPTTQDANPFDDWIHISKIKDWNEFVFAHCDTRDFHITFNRADKDTIQNWLDKNLSKFDEHSHIKLADIPTWLKSLEDGSGGVSDWRFLAFERIPGWTKYIRFYKVSDSECLVYTTHNDEDIPLRIEYMTPEEIRVK